MWVGLESLTKQKLDYLCPSAFRFAREDTGSEMVELNATNH